RAEMTALRLGGEIEPHGAAGERRVGLAAVMRAAVDAPADAFGHQRVIGGMELDEVDAVALAVHRPEPGRVLVRDAPQVERLGRAVVPAARHKRLRVEPAARRRLGQWLVGAEQIDVTERRRLVERGVFEESAHIPSLPPLARALHAAIRKSEKARKLDAKPTCCGGRRCCPTSLSPSSPPRTRFPLGRLGREERSRAPERQPPPSYLKESLTLVR